MRPITHFWKARRLAREYYVPNIVAREMLDFESGRFKGDVVAVEPPVVYRRTNKLIPASLVLSGFAIVVFCFAVGVRSSWDFLPLMAGGLAVEVTGLVWMFVAWEVDIWRMHRAKEQQETSE